MKKLSLLLLFTAPMFYAFSEHEEVVVLTPENFQETIERIKSNDPGLETIFFNPKDIRCNWGCFYDAISKNENFSRFGEMLERSLPNVVERGEGDPSDKDRALGELKGITESVKMYMRNFAENCAKAAGAKKVTSILITSQILEELGYQLGISDLQYEDIQQDFANVGFGNITELQDYAIFYSLPDSMPFLI